MGSLFNILPQTRRFLLLSRKPASSKKGKEGGGEFVCLFSCGWGGVEGAASVASSFHTSQLPYEAKGCSLKMGTLQSAV